MKRISRLSPGLFGERLQLEIISKISDLGVIFYSLLKFEARVCSKINKAYNVLGIKKCKNLCEEAFINPFEALVTPHLEIAEAVWSRYGVMCVQCIEEVLMRATNFVLKTEKLSYTERLKRLELPTMKCRRLEFDGNF